MLVPFQFVPYICTGTFTPVDFGVQPYLSVPQRVVKRGSDGPLQHVLDVARDFLGRVADGDARVLQRGDF